MIATAETGKENNNKRAVFRTDHTKSRIRSNVIPIGRMLIIVAIKFTAPKIDETPAK